MEGKAALETRANGCPHLGPMLCALAAAAMLLAGVQAYVSRQLPGKLPFYAAYAMSFKVNANVLQAVAFRTPGELPIYGSSELDRRAGNRADSFFRRRPTGFAVFPVGRGGATCLMIQQKIAAVGPAARGKKVVIFLSPIWFLEPLDEEAVSANLGAAQLSAWVFGDDLSPALKADIARRLRDFPGSMKNQPLIADAVQCLAEPTALNRLRFAFLNPLGKLQNALLEPFDYGVLLWEMVFPQSRWNHQGEDEPPAPPVVGGRIAWEQLAARAEAEMIKNGAGAVVNAGVRPGNLPDRNGPAAHLLPEDPNGRFISQLNASREFADLAMLIRVLKELKMQALFISQPVNGVDSDSMGVTPQTRHAFYGKLEALLAAAGYPLRDFAEREEDRFFFNDMDHPSAEAWIFFDREIDEFYSGGRVPVPAPAR